MPTPNHYGLPRKTLHSNGLFQRLLGLLRVEAVALLPLFRTLRENAPIECPLLTLSRGIRFSFVQLRVPVMPTLICAAVQPVLNPAA
jgi:hypothetical protein